MPSRAQLELRANAVGVNPANYVNDSVLEQRVIFQEKAATTIGGTLASSTLTSTGVAPTNGDTVTIGSRTYTLVTALTEVTATLTATLTAQPAANEAITIGNQTYRFVTVLSQPFDVFIGAANTNTAANLNAAIAASAGAGTTFANGTTANSSATSTVSTNVVTFTSRSTGTNGNGLTATTTSANITLSNGGVFSGGVNPVANQVLIGGSAANSLTNLKAAINGTAGAGTSYSSGTAVNPDVQGGTLTATTLVITATNSSVTNTATTKVAATLSWTGGTLAGGVRGQVVVNAPTAQAESGGAQV